MKLGDKVELLKSVEYDGGVLEVGSIWSISNIVGYGKEKLVLISDDGDKVFAVMHSSVKKVKQ